MVADTYRRYLDVALDETMVRTVICWGLSDRYSWIADLSLPQHRRADGAPPRPCLYDEALQAKPARAAVAAALAAAPLRIGTPHDAQ
jgi:endo-1,4-beta-xylanase